jgi:hypothetical protein
VIRDWWGEAPEKTAGFLQGGPHIPIDVVGYSDKRADRGLALDHGSARFRV